jgi:hypothetical protein
VTFHGWLMALIYLVMRKLLMLLGGKGARDSPSSYRPISLCSCVGKLLERVVLEQLIKYINSVRPLSAS